MSIGRAIAMLANGLTSDDCPDARRHTKCPDGYVDRSEWVAEKLRTHDQFRCPTCGFFAIWRRRPKREGRLL